MTILPFDSYARFAEPFYDQFRRMTRRHRQSSNLMDPSLSRELDQAEQVAAKQRQKKRQPPRCIGSKDVRPPDRSMPPRSPIYPRNPQTAAQGLRTHCRDGTRFALLSFSLCGYMCGYNTSWNLAGTNQSASGFWAERGIDFLRIAFALFDGRPLLPVPTPRDDEERFLSVGPIDGRFFGVIWTWRDGTIRIITARRARDEEEKRYRALYG